MNKKAYQQPAMRVVKIQHLQMLCTSDPNAYNEVSTNASYARQRGGWFDDEYE